MDFSKQNPTASLDRRENHRGYVKGNVQWVHKVVNIMKSNHDEAYFVAMCKQIADHRGGAKPLSRSQREALAGQPHTSRDRLTKSIDFARFTPKKPAKELGHTLAVGGMLF